MNSLLGSVLFIMIGLDGSFNSRAFIITWGQICLVNAPVCLICVPKMIFCTTYVMFFQLLRSLSNNILLISLN